MRNVYPNTSGAWYPGEFVGVKSVVCSYRSEHWFCLILWLALVASVAQPFQTARAQSIPAKGTDNTFEVATWNIEWFGAANGPSNDEQQFANALAVIRSSDIDLWALQEISDQNDFYRLLDSLGSNYDGALATYSQAQKTAFIYKTGVLSVREVRHVLETFESDFAGRPPLQMEATISTNPERIVTFVTVHMKANSELASHDRRLAASGRLKNHIDFSSLNSEMVVVLGDFNDLLDGSITPSQASPYANFLSDSQNYLFPTAELQADGRSTYCGNNCSTGSAIDHILVTNELFASYIDGSVDHYDELLSGIASYLSTTSDHLPVFASFQLNSGTTVEEPGDSTTTLSVYPNPSRGRFRIVLENSTVESVTVELIDILGRRVWSSGPTSNPPGTIGFEVPADGYPRGVYFVHVFTPRTAYSRKLVLN